jgi:hypothetical protein
MAGLGQDVSFSDERRSNGGRLFRGGKVDLRRRGLSAPPSRHSRRPEAGRPDRPRLQLQLRQPEAGVLGLPYRHPGPGRIYVVEPAGAIEEDPNLTDQKFPGNPTLSYRSREPLRVTSEVADWEGHCGEQLEAMKDHLERLKALGIEAID